MSIGQYLPRNPARRKCTRCRVGRCDRCLGPDECGCQNEAHAGELDPMLTMEGIMAMAGEQGQQDGIGAPENVVEGPGLDKVAVYLDGELGNQLLEAARLQDRDPDVVLKRAIEHYVRCGRGRCQHQHDEVPVVGPPAAT